MAHHIGERIKELRKNKRLTQKEFSEKILVTQSYLSRVETGVETPTDMLLKLISLEFNVPLSWLNGYPNNTELCDTFKSLDVLYDNGERELAKNRNDALKLLNQLLDDNNSNVVNSNVSHTILTFINTFGLGIDNISAKNIMIIEYLSNFMLNIFNTVTDFQEIHTKEQLESRFSLLKQDYTIGSEVFFNKIYSLCKNEFDDNTPYETLIDGENDNRIKTIEKNVSHTVQKMWDLKKELDDKTREIENKINDLDNKE